MDKKIEEVLTRGVQDVLPNKKALALLMKKRQIKLYQGFDPTGPDLHIGHAVALRKLRQFQDLGHKVIFLIGDFTAMVGDPSGKINTRKILTKKEVLQNAKRYKSQAGKILRFSGNNPVEIKYNSSWLAKMNSIEFFRLARNLTYQQVIERDMFQERIKKGNDIYINEFLYPFMQGYDSVHMQVDLEVGGTDQLFNMLMGRKLMRNILKKEKFVMTVPLLTDSQGVKIGKSEGNVIGLTDTPVDFFAKIMSLGDDAIIPCFKLLTDTPDKEIEKMRISMKIDINPRDLKLKLAYELTKWLNSEKEALTAQKAFEKTFQKGGVPKDIKTIKVAEKSLPLMDIVFASKLVSSRSEAKRLIAQSAIDIDQKTATNTMDEVQIGKKGVVLRIGKTKFVKIVSK